MTTTLHSPLATAAYIPSLDGWRAIAILTVLVSHMGLGHIVPGGLGVTIFFFLSGYLITTLLIQEHERCGEISIRHFYLRRVFRLMPPLVITLTIAYTLTYIGVTKGNVSLVGLMAQLLYFANYFYLFFDAGNSVPAGTLIFWSLSVEEHFYFVFPFVFFAFFNLKNGSMLCGVLISTCVVTLLWRYVLIASFDSSANRTYYATDTRIDSIVFGCLLALMKNPLQDSSNPARFHRREWVVVCVSVTALLMTLVLRNALFRETLRYTIQGLALAPLFYYSICRHKHWLFGVLNKPAIRKLGQYSYSIYLIHYFTIENMNLFQVSNGVAMLMVISLILLYAFLIDQLVDKPFLMLRKKFH